MLTAVLTVLASTVQPPNLRGGRSDSGSPRALLLDIDGTLVRTDALYFDTFAELLAPFGYDVTPEWYEKNVHGGVDKEVFTRLMPDTYGEAELLDMSRKKDALFCAKAKEQWVDAATTPTIPGLGDALLMARREGLRCIAVTNAPRPAAELCLGMLRRDLEAGDIIEDLIIGAECTEAKPSPEPYLVAMERLGVAPQDCIVFEDSKSGVRSGVAAGVAAVVGIRTELADSDLRGAGATTTVADWSEITAEAVEKMLAR